MVEDSLILLPAHNGARFIERQLTSIQKQTVGNWKMIVCDDHSKDGTQAIITRLASEDPRISLVHLLSGTGLRKNINHLFQLALANQQRHILLSDQDDEWCKNKLERQINQLRTLEAKYGETTPLLVHSDMEVIDETSHVIRKSFWKGMKIDPSLDGVANSVPVHNISSGNTVLFNKALLELGYPVPREAIMHDWWLALLAVSTGQISYLSEPLIRYRKHTSNVVGPGSFIRTVTHYLRHFNTWQEEFAATLTQVSEIEKRIIERHKFSANITKLHRYARLREQSFRQRAFNVWRDQLCPPDRIRCILFVGKVLLVSKTKKVGV